MRPRNAFSQLVIGDKERRVRERLYSELAGGVSCSLFAGWLIVLLTVWIGVPVSIPFSLCPLFLLLSTVLADATIRHGRIRRYLHSLVVQQHRDWQQDFPAVAGILSTAAEALEKERSGQSPTELEELALDRSNQWMEEHGRLFTEKSIRRLGSSFLPFLGIIFLLGFPFAIPGSRVMWKDVYLSSWQNQSGKRLNHDLSNEGDDQVHVSEKDMLDVSAPPASEIRERSSFLSEQKNMLAVVEKNCATMIGLGLTELTPSEQAAIASLAENERNWGNRYYAQFPDRTNQEVSAVEIRRKSFEVADLIGSNRQGLALENLHELVRVLERSTDDQLTGSRKGSQRNLPVSGPEVSDHPVPSSVESASGMDSDSSRSYSSRSGDTFGEETNSVAPGGSPQESMESVAIRKQGEAAGRPGTAAHVDRRPKREPQRVHHGSKPLPGYEKAVDNYLRQLP